MGSFFFYRFHYSFFFKSITFKFLLLFFFIFVLISFLYIYSWLWIYLKEFTQLNVILFLGKSIGARQLFPSPSKHRRVWDLLRLLTSTQDSLYRVASRVRSLMRVHDRGISHGICFSVDLVHLALCKFEVRHLIRNYNKSDQLIYFWKYFSCCF